MASSTGKSAGFRPFDGLVDKSRGLPKHRCGIRCIGPRRGQIPHSSDLRQAFLERRLGGKLARQAWLHQHGLHAAPEHIRKSSFKITCASDQNDFDLATESSRRGRNIFEKRFMKWVERIAKHTDTARCRQRIADQLEIFACEMRRWLSVKALRGFGKMVSVTVFLYDITAAIVLAISHHRKHQPSQKISHHRNLQY